MPIQPENLVSQNIIFNLANLFLSDLRAGHNEKFLLQTNLSINANLANLSYWKYFKAIESVFTCWFICQNVLLVWDHISCPVSGFCAFDIESDRYLFSKLRFVVKHEAVKMKAHKIFGKTRIITRFCQLHSAQPASMARLLNFVKYFGSPF